MSEVVTRFAPSPTGHLHLGHAFSALTTWRLAEEAGGRVLLRIEDIDRGRCRPEFEAAILEDLEWLGLAWEPPVRRQSEHFPDYADGLTRLRALGVLYPCFCSRKDIQAEVARSPSAPHGPEGALYPGTCRGLSADEQEARMAAGAPYALRIDIAAARAVLARLHAEPLTWEEAGRGSVPVEPGVLGDAVLARKDIPTSYHLSVTVDDALQGITLVSRGADLFHATHLHRLLQALFRVPAPRYAHHRLIEDESGSRLAKRHRAVTLSGLRRDGYSAAEIRRRLGFS